MNTHIPAAMKAIVFEGTNQITLRSLPVPEVKEGNALVKIKAAGLCITDVHVIKGSFSHSEPPCVLGHEVAGEIVSIPGKPAYSSLKEGDRVVVETMIACGTCEQCISGFKNLCIHGGDIGEPPYPGGYCEYISVPLGNLYKIPDSMSYEEAAIFESFVCPVGGLMRIGIAMGDVVLIQGLGPAGLSFTQAAKVMGAAKIIVSDTNPSRLELASRYGAHVTINPVQQDIYQIVMSETGQQGADISIDASGAEAALRNSIDLCRKNGKVIYYGIPDDRHKTRFDVTQIILKQLNIYGTSGAPWAWERTLELYGQGVFNIKDMVTHVFPLEEMETAIEALLNPENNAVKVVLKP